MTDNGFTSDVKGYTEVMDDEVVIKGGTGAQAVADRYADEDRGKTLLKRLAP